MATAARASGPETRKARTAGTVQASTIFINNGETADKRISVATQHLPRVPRIIRVHWLRPEQVEAVHG